MSVHMVRSPMVFKELMDYSKDVIPLLIKKSDSEDIESLKKKFGTIKLPFETSENNGKRMLDYIVGKSIDLYGKGVMKQSTCDKYLCDKCTHKINYKDYCKKHYEMIKEEI